MSTSEVGRHGAGVSSAYAQLRRYDGRRTRVDRVEPSTSERDVLTHTGAMLGFEDSAQPTITLVFAKRMRRAARVDQRLFPSLQTDTLALTGEPFLHGLTRGAARALRFSIPMNISWILRPCEFGRESSRPEHE